MDTPKSLYPNKTESQYLNKKGNSLDFSVWIPRPLYYSSDTIFLLSEPQKEGSRYPNSLDTETPLYSRGNCGELYENKLNEHKRDKEIFGSPAIKQKKVLARN